MTINFRMVVVILISAYVFSMVSFEKEPLEKYLSSLERNYVNRGEHA